MRRDRDFDAVFAQLQDDDEGVDYYVMHRELERRRSAQTGYTVPPELIVAGVLCALIMIAALLGRQIMQRRADACESEPGRAYISTANGPRCVLITIAPE